MPRYQRPIEVLFEMKLNFFLSLYTIDCVTSSAIDTDKSMFSNQMIKRAAHVKAPFLQCRQHFHCISLNDLQILYPPDTIDGYDLQFRYNLQDLKHYKQTLTHDLVLIYSHAGRIHYKNTIRNKLNRFLLLFSIGLSI
jgi:hypothetical protein